MLTRNKEAGEIIPDLIPTSLLFSHVFTISASKVRTAWIPKLEVSHLGRPAEVSGPSFAMKVEFPRGISARMVKLFVKMMMKTSGQHMVPSESPVETLEVWQSIDFKPGQALERHKSHFSPRVSNKPGLQSRFTKDSYVVKSRLVMV